MYYLDYLEGRVWSMLSVEVSGTYGILKLGTGTRNWNA